MAQMGRKIENKVMALTEENRERIEEETGIQSSLTEEGVKQYFEEVISEVRRAMHSEHNGCHEAIFRKTFCK
jgi:Tfp pilus assembly PilM family ATPase